MNAYIIKLVVAAAMVFTPVLAMAQWKVGVEGGIVRNTLLVSKCYDYDRHYISGTSGIIGIPVRYDFHDWFGLQAEVSCLTKNYSMYRSDIFGGNYYNYINGYLNIPVYAPIQFRKPEIARIYSCRRLHRSVAGELCGRQPISIFPTGFIHQLWQLPF